jgi:putative toxin-antitoxin system antitoxin component (TIGR02293 family)
LATQFEEVGTLLGVPPGELDSPLDLAHSIEEGLQVSAVDRVAKAVAPDDPGFKFRIVPKPTLERRRRSKSRLKNEEGEKVARLARVFSMGLSVFGDEAKVQQFLSRPHMLLDNKRPVDVALSTGPGAEAVINIMGRAAYSGGV